MKKTFTRALSLILVLVTLIGVMPMAFAKEAKNATVTLNSTTVNLKVSEKHQVSVTGMMSEGGSEIAPADITSVSYKGYNSEVISVSDTGEITALKAGETSLTVEATASKENWTYDHVGTATVTVTVTADPTYSSEAQTVTLSVGEEKSLDPTAALKPAYTGEAITWTLSGGNDKVSVDGMKIKGLAAGSATITASTTAEGIPTVTYNVTVSEPEYVVTLEPASLDVAVGADSEEIVVTVKKGQQSIDEDDYTLGWISSDETVATVNSGVVTGKKVGTAKITAVVTKDGKEYPSNECTVTVTEAADAVIECKNADVEATEKHVLKPELKVGGTSVSDVKFKFEVLTSGVSKKESSNKKELEIGYNDIDGGLVEVKISVLEYKPADADEPISGEDIEPLTVYVRFYTTVAVDATVVNGKTSFHLQESNVFSKVLINDEYDPKFDLTDRSFSGIMEALLPINDLTLPAKAYFILYSANGGKLADKGGNAVTEQGWDWLDNVVFSQSQNRLGATIFYVKVVDARGLIMLEATWTIEVAGGEGDIHYETTYNKAIKFQEADFQAFWKALKLESKYTLEYVMFDPSNLTGILYTDSSSSKQTVTKNMKFAITPNAAKGYKDLGSVYFVPNSKNQTEYMESINFTAVSPYFDVRKTGTLTIGLNKTSANISSRGASIKNYEAGIATTYKTNTGATLGYVIFDLPEAKYGKLYRELPSETKVVHGSAMNMTYVAEGTELKKDEALWYTETSGKYELADAAFIPAAGCKGEVELTYTAYDKYNGNAYKGILRFNVSAKTASGIFSDVTSKSYSWAADSADFLYYEGVAQGSKAAGSNTIKYNPSANITRRDFMLMLYRAFLAKNYSTFNVTSNFPDVVKGTDAYSKEIYQAVGVAKYLGIAQGSNDKFNPKANITRQEAMVLIYRTLDVINKNLEYTTTANVAAFKDANKISSWATSAITYLVNHGVIQGSNDKINPSSNITRAEMACILHRVLTY